ncbi:dienelactone hydrolase family protein, partial [filamentous cyanobacterium LEGE 11480]
IKSVCDRLAKAGYAALAPDFYQGASFAYDQLQGAIAKLKTMQDDVVAGQFGKGLEFLAQQPNVKSNGVGVIGFCMGGRFTFLNAAVHADRVKAGVAYYGGGISATADGRPNAVGQRDLISQAPKIKAPMMFMYGTEDALIAAEEHQRVAYAMSKAKKSYAINVFEGAQHGFDSDRRANYNPAAAEEAWERTIAFFDRHVKCG